MTPSSIAAGRTEHPAVTPDASITAGGAAGPDAAGPVASTRLVVARARDAMAAGGPVVVEVAGPEFVATPVLAGDGDVLVAVGERVDTDGVGRLEVWRGQPHAPALVADLGPGTVATALVHHAGTWHLFGRDDTGRAVHRTSDDLVAWRDDTRFADEHPHLSVRGATSSAPGVVLLGEVAVGGRRIGWTLLDLIDGRSHAREVTFPLTPAHDVIGPVHLGGDRIALVVSSASSHLVARSIGGSAARSWAVGLLLADVVPTAAAADADGVWIVGADPADGAAVVAKASGGSCRLDPVAGAPSAVVAHRDLLVIAAPVAAVATSTTGPVGTQSSPAYIDSISSE